MDGSGETGIIPSEIFEERYSEQFHSPVTLTDLNISVGMHEYILQC